jgi:nucleoside-diphosphate-sugar epimerase
MEGNTVNLQSHAGMVPRVPDTLGLPLESPMAGERIVGVAGATGFVGRHIVRELLSRGWSVRGLVRSREKARQVLPRDERLRLIEGEAIAPDAAPGLAAGAAAIVNAAGILRESAGNSFRKAHVQTTRSLVEAAASAGVPRFILVSAVGVCEDAPTAYQRTKFEAEQIVRRSPLLWTILRPSLVHGPEGELIRTARGWVTGSKQPWFFLPYFTRAEVNTEVPLGPVRRIPPRVQPIAVEDVAWATAQALERPQASGEVFNLVGPDTLTWPQFLEALQEVIPGANAALRPLGIPARAAAVQARVAKMLGLGGLLPFDEGMAIMGSQDSVASPSKAQQLLGLQAKPFVESLRRYAARL